MLQKEALSILKLGHTTFLTGAAGSGKSFVLREYVDYLRRHGIKYAVTASTGIASTYINGSTIHSWSGIGIKDKLNKFDLENIEEKKNYYKRWTETQVLIIDEVSMLHKNIVDSLDRVAKHMRRNDLPFGGMQIVFSGDFFQLPPVVRDFSNSVDREGVYAFLSDSWKEAKPVICYLTEQFRQDDNDLSNLLNAIRAGDIDEEHWEILKKTYKEGSNDSHIKLYTHNVNVDEINNQNFENLKGEVYEYEMITKGKGTLVESLKNNCLAEEMLRLKIGAKVICIKNDPERKFMNGSMGIISHFEDDDMPVVKLNDGKTVKMKSDVWKIEEDGKVKAEITQIPLKHAWAITIHKSQGMTLDNAEIDLSRAFGSGMGYVALSRLRSIKGLNLKGIHNQALEISQTVKDADEEFKKKSEQAVIAIKKYSEKELQKMYNDFILESEGSIKELEVTEEEDLQPKKPSYILTKELLDEEKSVSEIAKIRAITKNTVLDHIEKLVEEKMEIKLKHLMPKEKDKKVILASFKKLKTTKLTPVYEALNGKYDYDTIRVVRLTN